MICHNMQRFIVSMLMATILFAGSTFAGMVFFRPAHAAQMNETSCMTIDCPAQAEGMLDAQCVEHCLQAFAPGVTVPATLVLVVVTVFVAFTIRWITAISSRICTVGARVRSGIRIYLLQQTLASVMLRN